ncbi:hypothetical protein EMIT079MI2_70192 [Bacillus sp. IT-79MI2]
MKISFLFLKTIDTNSNYMNEIRTFEYSHTFAGKKDYTKVG